MKKLIAVLLCACLLFGFVGTIPFAAQTTEDLEQTIWIPEDDSQPDTEVSAEKWEQINDFMEQIDGSGMSFRIGQKNTSLDSYLMDLEQTDSYYMYGDIIYQNRGIYTWENDFLLPSTTIGISTHGCALVSFTMALNMGFGYSLNPGQVNTYLYANGQRPDTFSDNWKNPYNILNCDKYTVGSPFTRTQIEEIIATDMYYFQKGFIVRLEKGASSHYVFACGFDDISGLSIYIYDPWYPRNYHWLDTYYANGWSMTSARLFR